MTLRRPRACADWTVVLVARIQIVKEATAVPDEKVMRVRLSPPLKLAFLLGCVGAWSLHPAQIGIAKKVFSPDPDEVKFAKKVIEAIPDGRGVHMIDGKMQDDATWKQCKVMVNLAEMLAKKDPELAEAYGMSNGKAASTEKAEA